MLSHSNVELPSYAGFKPGDIISTYHRGWWRLLKIVNEGKPKPTLPIDTDRITFYYEKLLCENFSPAKRAVQNCCHWQYCKKLTPKLINSMLAAYKANMTAVLQLIQPGSTLEDILPADVKQQPSHKWVSNDS